MKFKQKCMICQKASITGGSDIEANVFTQYRVFMKNAEKKGWHILHIENKGLAVICPFCNRRLLKQLEKIKKEGNN